MYNKQANIKLETSSHISNRLNTGVEFYNTDIGTAELVFYLTRNNKPLLVSAENVDCYLILKSGDDYVVDNPTVKDAMNGVLSYVVPADLLGVANGKNVLGQLYLAVKGKEDVVTEVDFSFAVKDALINTIPAVDKLHEIRTMQEFKQSITTAIQDINNSIENSKAYLGELEAMYKTGLTKLQAKSDEAEQSLTTLATNKQNALEDAANGELDKINQASQTAQDNINALNQADTSNWQKSKLTADSGMMPIIIGLDFDKLDDYVDKTEFVYVARSLNQPAGESSNGFILVIYGDNNYAKLFYTPFNKDHIYVKQKLDTKGWTDWNNITKESEIQKLSDVTKRQSLGELTTSVYDLEGGFYQAKIPADPDSVNAPVYPTGGTYSASIDVYTSDEAKVIRLIQDEVNQEFVTTITGNNVQDWKQIYTVQDYNNEFSDSGWVPITTVNGAVKRGEDDETEIDNEYRLVKQNGIEKAIVRLNLSNITTNTAVCYLPVEAVRKKRYFYVRTSPSKNVAFCYIDDTDGGVYIILNMADRDNWKGTDYIVVEQEYILN